MYIKNDKKNYSINYVYEIKIPLKKIPRNIIKIKENY